MKEISEGTQFAALLETESPRLEFVIVERHGTDKSNVH